MSDILPDRKNLLNNTKVNLALLGSSILFLLNSVVTNPAMAQPAPDPLPPKVETASTNLPTNPTLLVNLIKNGNVEYIRGNNGENVPVVTFTVGDQKYSVSSQLDVAVFEGDPLITGESESLATLLERGNSPSSLWQVVANALTDKAQVMSGMGNDGIRVTRLNISTKTK